MDSDEEEGKSSWISYRALKKAADVRSSFTKGVNSPGAWPGIGSERRANQVTNVSLSFLNVHCKYRENRPSEASTAELDQVLRETEELQALVRSREEHYKAKYAVMMGYLQEAGKRKKDGDVRASLGSVSLVVFSPTAQPGLPTSPAKPKSKPSNTRFPSKSKSSKAYRTQ